MKEKLNKIGNKNICPVAIISKDGLYLVGCRHYSPKNIVWTNVGGRSEIGETIEQTLRREVREEVGIDEFDIVDYIGEVGGAKKGDIVPIFFARTNCDAKLMEPEKFSEWKWISFDDYFTDKRYSGINPDARKMIINYLKNIDEKK
jgi:ADP-ribose pyrophosphatase YjhB (NUDIX family)